MLETLFVAAALGVGGPVPAPPPARPAGLSADIETSFADTLAQSALASPAPQNKTELLTLAGVRYERALKQNPAHAAASRGVARMHSLLGDQARAAAAFARHLAAHPADAVGFHEAALSYARFGDWAAATDRCATAARLDPRNRQYGTTLGFCLARAGRWEDAEAAFARVMPADDVRMNMGFVREHVTVMARESRPAPAVETEPPALAPAPRELSVVTAGYHFRNVAAADAAGAVTRGLDTGREVHVDIVGNQLVVRGSPAVHARMVELVGELDRDVPQVVVAALVAEVPERFLADCGLTDRGGCFSLTTREMALFQTAFRHYPNRAVLSRPQLQVRDNQTGHVQLGQNNFPVPVSTAKGVVELEYRPIGVALRVTPRVEPEGKVLLRVETTTSAPAATPVVVRTGTTAFPINTQSVNTTVLVPDGQTVILVGPTAGDDGKRTTVLLMLTPSVVRP